ncbi:MAG: PLP-dependent aminotransferase family protein [Carbonactinosporaceae bacterium]
MQHDNSWRELMAALRAQAAGLAPGDRLPSTRDLVRTHHVSPVTVSRALAVLAAEGAVVTRPGSGTYVAHRRPTARVFPDTSWQTVTLGEREVETGDLLELFSPPPAGVIPLSGGYLHTSLQPVRALATALARAGRRPEAWERPPIAGIPDLREWFLRSIGGTALAAEAMITSGGQSALVTAFRAIAPPGAPVLVEAPTYPGALAAARLAGLRAVPVPVDAAGVRPDLLAEAFAVTGARLFYCQPTFHNPTGAVLAAQRRQRAVEVARAAGAFVVEDDFARWLDLERTAPPPLAAEDPDGTIVHVASLTKICAPSLRVGAVVGHGPVMERLCAARFVEDFFVSRALQGAALELVSAPAWARHVRTVRSALRERRDAMIEAVRRHLPDTGPVAAPAGGMHVWLQLPAGHDERELAARARAAGVLVSPGRSFFAAEPSGPFIRLTYAAASCGELEEGVRRLGTLLGPRR